MLTPSRILKQAGNFINASEAHRGALICWMAIPIYTTLLLWCLLTLWASHVFDLTYYPQMRLLGIWAAVLIPLFLLLGFQHLSLQEKPRRSQRYTALVLCFYTLTTIVTCFLLGPVGIMSGLVLMGSPLIGMMLFPVGRIAWSVGCGLVFALLLYLLVANGLLPNHPLFHAAQSNYLTLCLVIGALGFTAYEAALMASLIYAWKSRESGVRQLSLTDSLTGVANRRRILELLELEFTGRRGDDGQHLGVIMIDIDHFKKINDTYGHQIGDHVLQATAHALRGCLRQQDHIGRYGGEEFLILLPATSQQLAQQIAERCRRTIDELELAGEHSLSLTASLGVISHAKQQVKNVDWLIQQADSAMYEAKKLGRNRVVSCNELLPTG